LPLAYRLKKARITGLDQGMKERFAKFSTKPFPAGSGDWIGLEAFPAARSNGLKNDTPAVR